jgi:hypothetical protein
MMIHSRYGLPYSVIPSATADCQLHGGSNAQLAQGDWIMKQPNVREINAHLFGGSRYCYVDLPDGRRLRISRARTRKGVVEGRVIVGSERDWEAIPAGSHVELN